MERDRQFKTPTELNGELRELLEALPKSEIGIMGTLSDDGFIEGSDIPMTDQEKAAYRYMFDMDYDGEEYSEILANQAKADVLRHERVISPSSGFLITRLNRDLIPFVQGTNTFKRYVVRKFVSLISDGLNNPSGHTFYGDERGVIFHDEAVESIEESSLRVFAGDIEWYGASPLMRIFTPSYDEDPDYRDLVDMGRLWKSEFAERYGRIPTNKYGGEIIIP